MYAYMHAVMGIGIRWERFVKVIYIAVYRREAREPRVVINNMHYKERYIAII